MDSYFILRFYLVGCNIFMIFPSGFEKSLTTCESEINPLTAMENSFLQRLFKHLLSDVFNGSLSCLDENFPNHEPINTSTKHLAQSLFRIQENLSLTFILSKMGRYLMEKSPSFSKGELNKLLEIKYSNVTSKELVYHKDQILFTEVKINACFQALEQMPQKMKNLLYSLEKNEEENIAIKKTLQNYQSDCINFLVVYFGNYDFRLANKEHFSDSQIRLFGKKLILKTQVVFVSKVALVETFKSIIKMPNLEQMNQMIIELYQFKRARGKEKRRRNSMRKSERINPQIRGGSVAKKENTNKIQQYGIKAMIGITAVGFAVAIGKIFG